jgi:hypothetical protein
LKEKDETTRLQAKIVAIFGILNFLGQRSPLIATERLQRKSEQ